MSRREKEPQPCTATMRALFDPDHTHRCEQTHDGGDHMCADAWCGRWFGGRSVDEALSR